LVLTSISSPFIPNSNTAFSQFSFPHSRYDLMAFKYAPPSSSFSSFSSSAPLLFAQNSGTFFSERVLQAVLDPASQLVYGLAVISCSPYNTFRLGSDPDQFCVGGANDLLLFSLSWTNGMFASFVHVVCPFFVFFLPCFIWLLLFSFFFVSSILRFSSFFLLFLQALCYVTKFLAPTEPISLTKPN
jgi:hypothetical protein